MKKISVFSLNMGEHFNESVLVELCSPETPVQILVNDINFLKNVRMYADFGIDIIKSEYLRKGGNFCSARGCSMPARPMTTIKEEQYLFAQALLPVGYDSNQVSYQSFCELLADASKAVILDECKRLGIQIKDISFERIIRNKLDRMRERDKLTDIFLENGLINEKKLPICRGILALFNKEIQAEYQEIEFVVPFNEEEIFQGGIDALEKVFGKKSKFSVRLY